MSAAVPTPMPSPTLPDVDVTFADVWPSLAVAAVVLLLAVAGFLVWVVCEVRAGSDARAARHLGELVEHCPDCAVAIGATHEVGCDIARCLHTGAQRLTCEGGHFCGYDRWSGRLPDPVKQVRESAPRMVRHGRYRDDGDGPMVWLDDPAPGGFVCAVPDPDGPDGLCGMPVEDEPCTLHKGQNKSVIITVITGSRVDGEHRA